MFNSYESIENKLITLPWSIRGYMLFSIDRKYHCSLINPEYQKILNLVSGQSDIKYISLESLFYKKNINTILKYFPEYNDIVVKTVIDYNNLKEKIYQYYLNKKCFKNDNIIPKKFNKTIYDIHGIYIKCKKNKNSFKVSIDTVDSVLKNYDCAYLFYLLYK